MTYIVHVLSRADWDTFQDQEEYHPRSLDEQGFVHCSKIGQIGLVADYNHADDDELMLVLLDESHLDAPVRYETDGEDGKSAFPHVYGPLTLDAVIEIFPFEQDETGFRLPEDLLKNRFTTSDSE
ncbi:DUF952 domain-containing protein [Halorubrum sp. LN27]|uniref:DUF952 domain-containing protein n=1 Tax=Halorubrum sp. LN27 TaxID=2801032 RepID=UPI00190CA720|nr:DUF952 domain-containing protein [Halorubrum sp. LN27]